MSEIKIIGVLASNNKQPLLDTTDTRKPIAIRNDVGVDILKGLQCLRIRDIGI